MHTHAHTARAVETLTPALVALLVETPERQAASLGERGQGQDGGRPSPLPYPGGHNQSHQTNSLHTEQNVGCPKKVAMNSWCLM